MTPHGASHLLFDPLQHGWSFGRHNALALGLVGLAHASLIVALYQHMQTPTPFVELPKLVARLVAATPPEPIQPPQPLPVRSPPEPPPKPKPQAPPAPKAPPVETAVSAPPPAAPVPESAEPLVAEAAPASQPAPPAPPAAQPLAVEPPRSDAAHLNNPPPAYPAMARRLNETGRVVMDVYILADGSVGQIKLKHSSGFARLDQAALAAVRQWRYVPARQGGTAIAYWYVQPLNFALDS